MRSTLGDGSASGRIALGLEYDGRPYKGWQAQGAGVNTVQETLEAALSKVADCPLKLSCAGRTDAGVHASAQVAHFDCPKSRPAKAWVQGGNSALPATVSVLWAQPVNSDFHARFSALSRHYRYVIHNRPMRSALLQGLVTPHYHSLDADLMHEGGQFLLGEQDFTSYRAQSCQSTTPMRRVIRLDARRRGDYVIVDIEANAFLLHMVRNIVGVLLAIGEGRRPPGWALEVLQRKDRSFGAATAPPQGLYLAAVSYPLKFGLPAARRGASLPDLLLDE